MLTFFKILTERLHFLLTSTSKWNVSGDVNLKINDIVLFLFNESNSETDWRLGKVLELESGKAKILYTVPSQDDGPLRTNSTWRSQRQIVKILSEDEIAVTNKEYFARSSE